jgi:hypothetical protein
VTVGKVGVEFEWDEKRELAGTVPVPWVMVKEFGSPAAMTLKNKVPIRLFCFTIFEQHFL